MSPALTGGAWLARRGARLWLSSKEEIGARRHATVPHVEAVRSADASAAVAATFARTNFVARRRSTSTNAIAAIAIAHATRTMVGLRWPITVIKCNGIRIPST